MQITIDQLGQLINGFNERFELPDNQTVIAIFENNDSDEIIGWSVVETGVEADYPIMTIEELFEKYDK